MTIKKTQFFTIFIFILVLIFVACSSKSESSKTEETTQPVQQTADQPGSTQAVLTDGQIISLEQFIFTIPKDWKGDEKTQVWCPATENLDIPLPPVSLHCGGIPVMPGTTIDNKIKTHIGTEPLQKKHVTVCGYKGFVCQWESYGYKHMGLFLEEKAGGGMSIINFFICQAPKASFDTYAKTFKQIIDSVKCK
jgi:hypothetical protein